jgi:hypothetical protein
MSHPAYLRAVLTVAAVAVAVSHAIWPRVTIDGVTLGLIGLALLPWLAPIIKSVELPGIGKIELQEVKAQVEELRGQTASATQKANTALASRASSLTVVATTRNDAIADQQFLNLAARYNLIRKTQKSGPLRTEAMTDIVGEMIDLAYSIPTASIVPLLEEEDEGKRLFAYAYTYARPEPELLPELVRSVTNIKNKPFGQYWGIQAIARIIQRFPNSPSTEIANRLRSLMARLQKDTDRYYELSKIMESLEGSP